MVEDQKSRRAARPSSATRRARAAPCAAALAVMISGLNQPAQLIIFGNLLDSFNTADTAEAVRLVHFFALMYAVVGIQQLITITLQTALATRVAAAQARRCREKYFAAVLSRPISWFDQSDQGAVGASVLESTLAIQDGLGEKLTTALQGVFAFVFGLAVSLYYAWSLALVSVGALPIVVVLLGLASRSRAGRTPRRQTRRRPRRPSRTGARQRADRGGVRRRRREMNRYAAAARAADATLGAAVSTGARTRRSSRASSTAPGPSAWYGSYFDPPGHEAPRLLQLPPRRVRRPPRAEQQVHLGRRRDRRPSSACFGGLALLPGPPGHRRLPAHGPRPRASSRSSTRPTQTPSPTPPTSRRRRGERPSRRRGAPGPSSSSTSSSATPRGRTGPSAPGSASTSRRGRRARSWAPRAAASRPSCSCCCASTRSRAAPWSSTASTRGRSTSRRSVKMGLVAQARPVHGHSI